MTERLHLDPAYAISEDIMAAAGISRRMLTDWIDAGLLPRPVKVSQGFPRGVFNRFDASAVTQARFVAAKHLEGLTIDEIVNILARPVGLVSGFGELSTHPPLAARGESSWSL